MKEPKVTKFPNFGLSECKMVGCPVHDKQASEGKVLIQDFATGKIREGDAGHPLNSISPSRETAGWNDFPLRDAIMKWHKIQNEYDAYDKPKEVGYVQGVYQKIFDIVYDLILAAEKRGEEKSEIKFTEHWEKE